MTTELPSIARRVTLEPIDALLEKAFEDKPPWYLNPEKNPGFEVYIEPLVDEFNPPLTLIHNEPGLGPWCDVQVKFLDSSLFMGVVEYFKAALNARKLPHLLDVQIAEKTAVAVFEYNAKAHDIREAVYEVVRETSRHFGGIEERIF